eukprot:m.119765 g.119765  ORF g.119765 m.119765 type:complete len:317 (+) comp37710_c0_seq10:186-1136(+)
MVCSSRRSPSATCKNTDRICQSVYSNLRTIPDNSTVTCTNRVLWQSLGDSWTESTSTDYSICPASALALAVIQGRHERSVFESDCNVAGPRNLFDAGVYSVNLICNNGTIPPVLADLDDAETGSVLSRVTEDFCDFCDCQQFTAAQWAVGLLDPASIQCSNPTHDGRTIIGWTYQVYYTPRLESCPVLMILIINDEALSTLFISIVRNCISEHAFLSLVRSVLVVGAVDSETGSPLDNLTIAVNLVEEDRTTAVATVTNTTGFNTTIDVPRNRQFIVTVSRFGFASSSSIVRSSQADIVDVDFFLIRRPADGRLQR